MSKPSPLAQRVAALLYQAGKTRAGSVVLPTGCVSFAEYVDRELAPTRDALKEMLEVYWGTGDGQVPPPACVTRAQAALEA